MKLGIPGVRSDACYCTALLYSTIVHHASIARPARQLREVNARGAAATLAHFRRSRKREKQKQKQKAACFATGEKKKKKRSLHQKKRKK